MGNCLCQSGMTAEEREKEKVSRELERRNEQDAIDSENEIKLLLLGAGESGKSTIFKQMKILYGNWQKGITAEDQKSFRTKIHQNVLTGIKALCDAVATLDDGVLWDKNDKATRELMDEILELNEAQIDLTEDQTLGEKLDRLWKHPSIQAVWERRTEFHIIESHKTYFNKIPEICRPDYLPNQDDILASRVRTTGVIQEHYDIDNNDFLIIDVGGQTSERRKWIHQFSNCKAVIFVAALSEYDQTLFEDNTKNRMIDALELFQKISNEPTFQSTSMILFLNKKDLFQDKIAKTPISSVKFFADYAQKYEVENDFDKGIEYFTGKFLDQAHDDNRDKVYTHVTCATDSNNVKHIFNSCKAIILKDTLSASGFMS